MAPRVFWDELKVETIRQHAPTMTSGQMVRMFFPSVSRNALIGVAYRHGITFKKPIVAGNVRKRIRKRKPYQRRRAGPEVAPELAPDLIHMRGSSAPAKVRPQMNRSLPPADSPPADVRSPRRLAFEEAPEGAWTLWNIGHGQCHFPIGHDGRLTLYCGDVVWREGGTYCRHHIGLMTSGGMASLAAR